MDYALRPPRRSTSARVLDVVEAVVAWLMPALFAVGMVSLMATTELMAPSEAIPVLPLRPLIGGLVVITGLRLIYFAVRVWVRSWRAGR